MLTVTGDIHMPLVVLPRRMTVVCLHGLQAYFLIFRPCNQYATNWQPAVASHIGARGAAQLQMPIGVS